MNQEQTSVPVGLVPMEEELEQDTSGAYKDGLLQLLAEQGAVVKKAMDVGAAPGEFAKLEAMARAIATASTIVERAWKQFHPA